MQKKFKVHKTVSLLSDPEKINFFYMMGIDRVVCAISAVTGIIEQQTFIEEMTKVIPLGKGSMEILEIPITSSDPVAEKQICEICLPDEAVICCILRGGKSLIPRGNIRIFAGDILVLISGNNKGEAVISELKGSNTE